MRYNSDASQIRRHRLSRGQFSNDRSQVTREKAAVWDDEFRLFDGGVCAEN